VIDVAAIHNAAPTPLAVAHALGLEVARGSTAQRCRVLCPWHSERHPSCAIATKDGRIVAHCFSCGEGGDLLAIVAATHALNPRRDFQRVAELAADLVGVRIARDGARATPARRRDPAVDLALAIDDAAECWLSHRKEWPSEAIEQAKPAAIILAIRDLVEADRLDAAELAERDTALDAMADDVLARIAEREAAWLHQRT
jgi:hypothetical protein